MFKAGTPIRSTMGNTRRVVVAPNDTYTIVRSRGGRQVYSIKNTELETCWREDIEECCTCKWYEEVPFEYANGCGVCWKHTSGDFNEPTCWVQGTDLPCLDFKRKGEE